MWWVSGRSRSLDRREHAVQEADASGRDVRVELGEEVGLGLRGLLLGGAILFLRRRAVLLG